MCGCASKPTPGSSVRAGPEPAAPVMTHGRRRGSCRPSSPRRRRTTRARRRRRHTRWAKSPMDGRVYGNRAAPRQQWIALQRRAGKTTGKLSAAPSFVGREEAQPSCRCLESLGSRRFPTAILRDAAKKESRGRHRLQDQGRIDTPENEEMPRARAPSAKHWVRLFEFTNANQGYSTEDAGLCTRSRAAASTFFEQPGGGARSRPAWPVSPLQPIPVVGADRRRAPLQHDMQKTSRNKKQAGPVSLSKCKLGRRPRRDRSRAAVRPAGDERRVCPARPAEGATSSLARRHCILRR